MYCAFLLSSFLMSLAVRKADSHKGENGVVLVIGGSALFHGAPILAALGAEKSGVDLVQLMLPVAHAHSAKIVLLNSILQPFQKDSFSVQDIPNISHFPYPPDAILIGNGIGKDAETQRATCQLLETIEVPVILDAEALFPDILSIPRKSEWVVTPHAGEFRRLFQCEGTKENVIKMAQKHRICILRKGAVDIIADKDGRGVENDSGCPEMTVGGTGDVLAGLVAGFIAQGNPAFEACEMAALLWGKCGEKMAKTRLSFSAHELIAAFPQYAKEILENNS